MFRLFCVAGFINHPFEVKGLITDVSSLSKTGIYYTNNNTSGLPDIKEKYGILLSLYISQSVYAYVFLCPNATNVGVWWKSVYFSSSVPWTLL